MRHGKKFNHLGRTASHRKAMLANMASSLIEHKRINTTVAKAKALKKYVEPLITKSKSDNTHNRRIVFSYLKNKDAVSELFREVVAKVGDRPGGYTRIIKTGNRLGDNAEMCMIELVDFNEIYTNEKSSKGEGSTKTTRRSRRGGGKKASGDEVAAETKESPKKEASSKPEVAVKTEEEPKEEEVKQPEAKAKEEEAPKAEATEEETSKEEENKDSEGDKKE